VRFRNGGDGTVRGNFVLPELQAEMFRKALQALAAPKHVRATEGAGAYDYEKPTPHKLGLAFMEYIERYPLDGLPKQGGLAATVVITAPAETFTQGAEKAGHTETGTGVSPGQLIRLACEAKVFPAAMDTGGHVLDLGRGTRFHTPAQRLALLVEQQTCQHPSCDIPGAFCHVHHTKPWADGGHTNTRDAVLLCPFHHHQAHATGQTYPIRT
ncbi:MAG: HNH endonuclease, partial [Actinobacteria bacterium]|nr:HNH endonuclease [Actinomycetota bacterium]